MSRQLIIVSSITYAMKAKSILKSKGIYVDITKTSKYSVQQGCGYALILSKNVEQAIEILKNNNINILGVVDGGEHK